MAYVEYKMGRGLNLRAAPDLIGDDELQVATGCELFYEGQVRSEQGSAAIASNIDAGGTIGVWQDNLIGITEGYMDGTRYFVVQNKYKWSYIPADGGSATALSFPTLPSLFPLTGFDYQGYYYLTDGVNFRRWRLDEYVASFDIDNSGSGYTKYDELTASGGTGTPAQFRVTELYDQASFNDRIYEMVMTNPGDYSVFPSNPVTLTGGTGTGAQVNFTTSGNGLYRVGCQQPDTEVVKRVGTFVPGVSVVGQKFRWLYTFYNGVAESNFSPVMETETLTQANEAVGLTIPVDDQTNTGTVERRIYRTDNGPTSAYFYVGHIGDNTTTIWTDRMGIPVDSNPDAASGDTITNRRDDDTSEVDAPPGAEDSRSEVERANSQMWGSESGAFRQSRATKKAELIKTNLGWLADWYDHGQPPLTNTFNGPRNLVMVNERVFYILKNDTLAWGDVGNPEHYDEFRSVVIGRGYENGAGETLQAIAPMEEDMICYTDSGIWRFRIPGGDTTRASLEQVRDGLGVSSKQAVVETEAHGHIFISHDGIYQYNGNNVRRISDSIQALFEDPTQTYYVDPDLLESCCIAARDDVIYCSFRTTGDTVNSFTIRGDFRTGEPLWSISPKGYGTIFLDSKRKLYAGQSNNTFNSLDDGVTPDDKYWEVWTKEYPIRTTLMGEQAYAVTIDIDTNGTNVTAELYNENQTLLTSWNINTSARSKVRKLMPREGVHDRLSVRIYSTAAVQRTFYGLAFETDEARLD